MLLNEIIETLKGKQKGTFIRIGIQKQIESATAKKQGVSVTKQTDMTVRWGIKYANTKKAKQAEAQRVAAGVEKKERAAWCRHLEEFPAIVENLSDAQKKYLQLFPINKRGNQEVKYFINGKPATKTEVQASGYVNKGEWTQNECAMMTVPIENVCYIKTKKSKI